MHWSCGTHGRYSEMYTRLWLKSLKEGDSLEDLEQDGKIIMNGTLRFVEWEDADWIHLA
jgi:hypothetical protein